MTLFSSYYEYCQIDIITNEIEINNLLVKYYNTLFDENASCHLALGSAYAFNIEGGKEMTKEELEAAGANQSITHVDFMFGSEDMCIDGIKEDGSVTPIFKNGNWA